MNITQAKEAVKACYYADLPIFLSGPPGVGKSSIVYQLADELTEETKEKFGCIEFKASTADPSEAGDIKFVVTIDGEARAVNVPQDWVPTDKAIAKGRFPKRGFIFCDEILDGPLMIQSVLQGAVLGRKMGSAEISKDWYLLAASNRRSDNAAAGRLSTALARRYVHVTIESSVDVTVAFARKEQWNPIVPAFLRFRPGLLNTFESVKKGQSGEYAYACEASWEKVSQFITNSRLPEDSPIRLELISGIVGQGPAAEFYAFERTYQSLPDMKQLRQNPENYPIPEEPSVLYAVLGHLSHNLTAKDYQSLWGFIKRLPREFVTLFTRDAYRLLGDKLTKTTAWGEYVRDFDCYSF